MSPPAWRVTKFKTFASFFHNFEFWRHKCYKNLTLKKYFTCTFMHFSENIKVFFYVSLYLNMIFSDFSAFFLNILIRKSTTSCSLHELSFEPTSVQIEQLPILNLFLPIKPEVNLLKVWECQVLRVNRILRFERGVN